MEVQGREVKEAVGGSVVHTRLGLAKPGYGLKVFTVTDIVRTYSTKYLVSEHVT